MSSQEYLNMMKDFQVSILNFLEEEANSEENFLILEIKFNDAKISDCKYYLLSIMHLISKIVNNYHRFPNFFSKIERILLIFKENIKKYFTNFEIFNIFKSNKRLLLFLIEQQIIIIDERIAKKITMIDKFVDDRYPQYFHPEIKPFINEKWLPTYYKWIKEVKKELPEDFYEKRKEGENDNQICKLIQKDMIKEFIVYINQNNISLNAKIEPSIYETNSFLLHNKMQYGFSLIEYAAFFGSIQIFNYLKIEGAELTPSLWILAIHGQNAEMIYILEENHVELEDKSYKQVFYESIKCHNNNIANYFINNFLQNEEENSQDTINQCLKYYNFTLLKNESINESSFCNLYKYDYYAFVDDLLKNKDIDVNKKEISLII